MDTTDFMSVGWLKQVSETPENDVRAHQIALTYSHLARHLDELIHGRPSGHPPTNANWFNFALWGTLTVSQNIANDRPLQRLNSGPAMPLRRVLTPAVLNVKASREQEVARSLAWAQLLIFLSSCTALRLFAGRKPGARLEAHELSSALEQLELSASVTDPYGVSPTRHTPAMAKAFGLYARAQEATSNPAVRAQFVLGANVLLTEIEQDIADPAVSVVLDLVPRRLGDAVDWRLAKLARRFRGIPTHFSYLLLPFLHTNERRAVDAVWSRFMTDQVLVMALPTETLRVGRDIPPRRRDAPFLPADLVFAKSLGELQGRWICEHQIAKPLDCDVCHDVILDLWDVASLVRSLDRTVGDGRGSAARDWRRWDERMNWALTLMRSRQHDDTLFWHPYSTKDQARILDGDLPTRSGDPSALQVQPPKDELPLDVDLFARGESNK